MLPKHQRRPDRAVAASKLKACTTLINFSQSTQELENNGVCISHHQENPSVEVTPAGESGWSI